MALFPGLPGWAGTRKVKPIWILLTQETVSGSGISWAMYKSASRSRQITMPAPHHSVFTGRMPFLPPNQQCQNKLENQKRLSGSICMHRTLCTTYASCIIYSGASTHTQPFNGLWPGTTRVGQYQKKHSPTHTHPGHRTSFINFLHLLWSTASSVFSLRAWQSSLTTSLHVLFGLPLPGAKQDLTV